MAHWSMGTDVLCINMHQAIRMSLYDSVTLQCAASLRWEAAYQPFSPHFLWSGKFYFTIFQDVLATVP